MFDYSVYALENFPRANIVFSTDCCYKKNPPIIFQSNLMEKNKKIMKLLNKPNNEKINDVLSCIFLAWINPKTPNTVPVRARMNSRKMKII